HAGRRRARAGATPWRRRGGGGTSTGCATAVMGGVLGKGAWLCNMPFLLHPPSRFRLQSYEWACYRTRAPHGSRQREENFRGSGQGKVVQQSEGIRLHHDRRG